MTTNRASWPLRRPGPGRAGYLELFFDLVFVLALFRLSQLLLEDLRLANAMAVIHDPRRFAVLTICAHAIMVAGVLAIAVVGELVIQHPSGHTDIAWVTVILAGPALFLVGRALLEYVVFGRVSRPRVIAVLALVAIAPAMTLVPPLAVGIAALLVLGGVAVADAARTRRHPSESPAPPG